MVILGGNPIEIFVDPVYCAFGDVQGGTEINQGFDMSNASSLFNMSDEDKNSIQSSPNELDLSQLDLSI